MIRPISRKAKFAGGGNPLRQNPLAKASIRQIKGMPFNVLWAEVKPLPKDAEERTRLTWVARAIRNLPFEIAYYFHPDGNKILRKFVSLPESPLRVEHSIPRNVSWGSIHLHNHPTGIPFTPEDGYVYRRTGIGEAIVVDRQNIYYLFPLGLCFQEITAEGFKEIIHESYFAYQTKTGVSQLRRLLGKEYGNINSFLALNKKAQEDFLTDFATRHNERYRALYKESESLIENDEPHIVNKVWEELSQKYNLGYKVRKWKGLTGTI